MANMVDKYTYRIEWSEEDNAFLGRCLEFVSLSAHGRTQEKALSQIRAVVRESIRWLKEEGSPVPDPYGQRHFKGNLTLRVPESIHRELAIHSAEQGVSINQYILSKISH